MAADRIERKLTAILAADVAGYSRLMGADEEGTLGSLNKHRREHVDPCILKHRGRIVKTTGDGLLAEFTSVVDAVRCAVEMQAGMAERNAVLDSERRLEFRIGINVGDIVEQGGDIFGDGVNIAARLEGIADPGGICVSGRVQEDAAGKVDVSFEDIGEQILKNIARPIRAYRLRPHGTVSRRSSLSPAVGLPDRLSIAVLPFTNMSSDPEQEFFADGLAEDLITDLSKVPGLFVIARNSSFVFKGKAVDVRSVAKDLGVRYVIEGSVRRAAARIRINAQLIDASDNAHIWADRFDSDLADIFSLQDEVVGRIVSALSHALPSAQPVLTKRATNLEAYDLFVQGRMLAMMSPDGNRAARPLLEKTIALDPSFAEAHAWLAMTYHFGWLYWGEPVDPLRQLARATAARAVALDPENADAHWILGYVRAYDGEPAEGIAEFETALRINPNHADAWTLLADLMVIEGRPVEGIECVRKAFRLNPHPPGFYYWTLGWADYAARQYEDALVALRHEAARGTGGQRLLAASLAQLGRIDEAREEARLYAATIPHFSVQHWAGTQPFRHESDRQHFVDGFIKAGLPP